MAITGSIQEKNGRYHMVINMPTESGKTKPKWISTGLKTRGNKKQAQKMLEDKLSELNKYNLIYSKITVAEYFNSWLSSIQAEVRQNTYRSYCGNMKKPNRRTELSAWFIPGRETGWRKVKAKNSATSQNMWKALAGRG